MVRGRWLLLTFALVCVIAWLWWMGSPLVVDDDDDALARILPALLLPTSVLGGLRDLDSKPDYALHLAVFLGVLLAAQWMFLRPRKNWTVPLSEKSRPMKTAVAAAAFMAMMLSFAFVATLLELVLPDVWEGALDGEGGGLILATTVLWILWAFVFYAYWRGGDRFAQLRTMTRRLLAGSFVELLVATGVYAWNPHDEDCWCARGSYTGLVLGATVMVWAFGPGLLFLFLREKARRERLT